MTAKLFHELSVSQEDYLETILDLIAEAGAARVRDIARRMNVAKSSVTVALRSLASNRLVNYAPYELVTLSHDGKVMAEKIRRRHDSLANFLVRVLGVDEKTAGANACRIEHAVGEDVVNRLNCFAEFLPNSDIPARELAGAFAKFYAEREKRGGFRESGGGGSPPKDTDGTPSTAADLKPGETARIVRVCGEGKSRRRLQEMGVTRNAPLAVIRRSPLGDPIEVKVRGGSLSLRKEEAREIEVERVKQ
ncbi:MAG: metal-dependent transcriptional regulator [Verrucomicrobiae bacterium]|nr:metal-dependent transcriptional regulator [Verrucomicrobiae bacterium]